MSLISLRVNLSAQTFPFSSDMSGRSIINKQYDQNYDTTALNVAGTYIEKGIPQSFYMHNCLPTSHGYQAVGYKPVLPPYPKNNQDFDNAYPLRDPSGNRFLFVPASGKNYIFDGSVGSWASVSPFAPGTVKNNVQVTTAYVQNQSYIYYSGLGCFKYNNGTHALDPVTLTGLSPTNILGITASNGYMIAWTATGIAWSSLIDPTDFTPSLVTGAGGGQENEAKGTILACFASSGGFLIYCEGNVVGARYSGNINFPFITKEVPATDGVADISQVGWHTNMSTHYAWCSNGLQQIGLTSTTAVYPDFSDFIAGQIFEDFDELSLSLNSVYLPTQLAVKVSVINSRWIVFSYGVEPPDFTHALVIDLALNRWGKLKIPHRCCFEWNFPNIAGAITYGQLANTPYKALLVATYGDLLNAIPSSKPFKQSFAFLQKEGTVLVMDPTFAENDLSGPTGVLLLGKYQIVRAARIQHQQSDLEIVNENAGPLSTTSTPPNFDFYILPTWDGKTFKTPVKAFMAGNNGKTVKYKRMIDGLNLSFLLVGAFNVNSIVSQFLNAANDI